MDTKTFHEEVDRLNAECRAAEQAGEVKEAKQLHEDLRALIEDHSPYREVRRG